MSNFKMTSHKDEVLDELDSRVEVALEMIGLEAEKFAKKACTVDTGLLHNSITHALDGQEPAISEYQDNPKEQSGSYSGAVPEESKGKRAVYIGTNVEYAPYVEFGTSMQKPQPYLKPAVTNHVGKYRKILKSTLKGD
jgi:HK97 gp10 family phage protein